MAAPHSFLSQPLPVSILLATWIPDISYVYTDCRCSGHVNNARYLRYAETSRVHWLRSLAKDRHLTSEQIEEWLDLATPRNIGLILKEVTVKFQFVSLCSPLLPSRFTTATNQANSHFK